MVSLRKHLASNFVGYVALLMSMGGTAYAAATIGSGDVIDESLKSQDLKNGAAVKSADVRNDTLTNDDVNESTLSKVPNADNLDGRDSSDLVGSILGKAEEGSIGADWAEVAAGQDESVAVAGDTLVRYFCPANPMENNGTARVEVFEEGSLFIDNGGDNPLYWDSPPGILYAPVSTAPTGEALTIQMYTDSGPAGAVHQVKTIFLFSVHFPALSGVHSGVCHVQSQIVFSSD